MNIAGLFPGMNSKSTKDIYETYWNNIEPIDTPSVTECHICGSSDELFIQEDLTTCTKLSLIHI